MAPHRLASRHRTSPCSHTIAPRTTATSSSRTINLSDLRGKWVLLFFYPLDFTFVCPTEIVSFNKALGDFRDRNCEVLTASTDSVYSHKGWCDAHGDLAGLKYPMLADTTHELSKSLRRPQGRHGNRLPRHVPDRSERCCPLDLRSTTSRSAGSVEECLRILDALQTDKLCPCNWKAGEKTLS